MAKNKIYSKWNFKQIISAILVVAATVACIGGGAALIASKTKTISSFEFSVGGINEQGIYEKSDTSIYTKDMFECQGLSIEPDFEATGEYQVFYYNENKNYIGSTEIFSVEEGVYNKGDSFRAAKYARIVITSDVPVDENDNTVKDFKIHFYNAALYARDFRITVDKKQNFVRPELFDAAAVHENYYVHVDEDSKMTEIENDGVSFIKVNVKGYEDLSILYKNNAKSSDHSYLFFDAEDTLISSANQASGLSNFELIVPDGAEYFVINFTLGTELSIK